VVIVVDSSVWISKIRSDGGAAAKRLDGIEDPREILVPDLVMLEVLQGARSKSHAQRIERLLREFHIEAIMSPSLAVKAAANYRFLRSRGITIRGPLDVAIGTYCIEQGHRLLHDDRDFTRMAEHLGLELA
jgi:predicted nucleic acid-binding protein